MADEVPLTMINFRHKSLTALPRESKPKATSNNSVRKYETTS